MFRSLAARVLIALVLGLGLGAACGAIGNEGLTAAAGVVEESYSFQDYPVHALFERERGIELSASAAFSTPAIGA